MEIPQIIESVFANSQIRRRCDIPSPETKYAIGFIQPNDDFKIGGPIIFQGGQGTEYTNVPVVKDLSPDTIAVVFSYNPLIDRSSYAPEREVGRDQFLFTAMELIRNDYPQVIKMRALGRSNGKLVDLLVTKQKKSIRSDTSIAATMASWECNQALGILNPAVDLKKAYKEYGEDEQTQNISFEEFKESQIQAEEDQKNYFVNQTKEWYHFEEGVFNRVMGSYLRR